MFKTKIKILLFAFLIASQILVTPVTLAATLNIRAYGSHTVAGFPSLLKTSMLAPGKKVVFVVQKPNNSVVQIPAQANQEGVAKVDLYGNQTKGAGVYKVSVYYAGTKDTSPQNTFSVYPDKTSKTQSTITANTRSIDADGTSRSIVTVTLFDANRNVIPNHKVKLISSLAGVKIEALNSGVTDSLGRASFKVASTKAGVTTLSPLDATGGIDLEAREELVFNPPITTEREIGGNYFSNGMLSADVLNSQTVLPGPVDSFEIKDVPASVKVNTDQTITIVAKDSDGNVAKNYMGTIVISTLTDDNAILPGGGEYTFKETDQGKFTFNLALRFTQLGNQAIQVVDKDNWQIKGEFKTNVVSQQAVNQPSSASLSIKSPLDGTVLGTNSVVMTGKGDPNINLSVYADDMKVADAQTDTEGLFTHQFSNLPVGTHSLYVMSGAGQVSETVTIDVDTLPPVLNSLKIVPDGPVAPGRMLNITLNSEPNLVGVKVRLQGVIKDLFPVQGQPGNYSVNLAAPAIVGNFPVDVLLADELSNKSELLNQKTVSVQNQVALTPPQVKNVEGMAGEGEVLLSWEEIIGHTSAIVSYNVYYGAQLNDLDKIVQTASSKGMYKIGALENGRQYFFAVTAVDAKGIESQQKSQVIAVTPKSVQAGTAQVPANLPGGDQGIDLFDFDLYGADLPNAEVPAEIPTNTSATLLQASLYNNPLMGVPMDSGMTLNWQPFPGIPAAGYKAYFGLSSGQYDDYVLAAGNQTTVKIPDLINNVPYYFAVVAVDAQGKEISPLSAQYAGMPSGSAFHSAAPEAGVSPLVNFQLSNVPTNSEAGAASTGLLIVSLLVAGGLYYGRRKILS